MATVLTPQVLWAQRSDRVFVTVVIPDATEVKFELTNSPGNLKVTATSSEKHYHLDLDLFGDIVKEESTYKNTARNLSFNIVKAQKDEPFWAHLYKGNVKHANVLVDWDKFVDEDEQDEKEEFDFSDYQNLPNFSDMGGDIGGDAGEEEEDEAPPNLEDLE